MRKIFMSMLGIAVAVIAIGLMITWVSTPVMESVSGVFGSDSVSTESVEVTEEVGQTEPSVNLVSKTENFFEAIFESTTLMSIIAVITLVVLALTRTLPGTTSRFTLVGIAAAFLFVGIFPALIDAWQKSSDEREFGAGKSEEVRSNLQDINAKRAIAEATSELEALQGRTQIQAHKEPEVKVIHAQFTVADTNTEGGTSGTDEETDVETSSDTLPVGIWSKELEVKRGCDLELALGHGDWFQLQYRYYERQWHDFVTNSSVQASHIRYMVLEEGRTELPAWQTCS